MARLCAFADGNLTAAGTWEVIDATLFLDSQANNTNNTTAYVASAGQTPGAITIDAIAVKIASRIASPTGTASVRLATGGVLVAGTEVTVNVSDFPICSANSSTTVPGSTGEGGWFLFVLAAPVLLLAATAYTVDIKGSVNAEFALYRDGTAGNWSHFVRTTTTQAPAAGDDMVITAEWTAAATKTDRTVTMNSTANTDYGSASTDTTKAAIAICKGGSLVYGTTAATNYILRLSGHLQVYSGGVLNIGTTGTPMPRDSTAVLEFDCAADGGFGGIGRNDSTVSMQGLSRTSGKDVAWTKLAANMAASATAATTAVETGWKNGDEVFFSSTTQTYNDQDRKTLNADASGTGLAWTGGTTFAHLGTAPIQGEAILLTRNVKIRSVSSSNMTFFFVGRACTFDADWAEFRYVSGNLGTNKWGVNFANSESSASGNNGSCTLDHCSVYDVETTSIRQEGTNGAFRVNDCCLVINADANRGIVHNESSSASPIITSNVFALGAGMGLTLNGGVPSGMTLTGNVFSGSFFQPFNFSGTFLSAWSGNEVHSVRFAALWSNAFVGSVISQWTFWHCADGGVNVQDSAGVTFDRCKAYGNTPNYKFDGSVDRYGQIKFLECEGYGTTSFGTTNNVQFTGSTSVVGKVVMESCLWGVTSGVLVACTNTINFDTATQWCPVYADNCKFSDTNVSANLSNANLVSMANNGNEIFIRSHRHGQVNDAHRTYFPQGLSLLNSVTVSGAGKSQELQPSSASVKIKSGYLEVPVNSGLTATIQIDARKSAAYNGNNPRLMLERQDSLGITSDIVCDTLSVAADTWETLTYTPAAALENGVYKFYIDADGTAGSAFMSNCVVS